MADSDTTNSEQIKEQSHGTSLLQEVPCCPLNFSFAFFNLSAYFMLAGPAMILMLRTWHATAFQVGILLSMMPACQLIQLFIAPYIERAGIHKFVIGGLVARNVFSIFIAVLPFAVGYFGEIYCLYILLAVMLFVDVSHSIGYAGWMTWITRLVPQSHRGRYFSLEQLMNTTGQTLVSFASGLILGKTPVNEKFGVFFAICAVMGWLSIVFLWRIPRPPKLENPPKAEMFWKWIKPVVVITAFRKFLYVLVCTTMMVMIGNFGIIFLTEDLKITQNIVFYMGAAGTLGSAASVYFWGILADKYGSKPIMLLGQRMMLVGAFYSLALSLGLPYYHPIVIITFGLITAVGMVAYVVTGFRYVCNSLPQQYMVYGTIVFNLTVQTTASMGPMLWGKILDILEKVHFEIGPCTVMRFTPIYAVMLGWVVLANIFTKRLPDGEHKLRSHTVAIHGIKEFLMFFKKLIRYKTNL